MKRLSTGSRYAVCIANGGCDDLIPRKLYQVICDPRAEADALVRVIDESGEDYLYPAEQFMLIDLPEGIQRALSSKARAVVSVG